MNIKLPWGSPVERERKLRIQLAVYAYAYEFDDTSLIDDHAFDQMCLRVNRSMSTGNEVLDQFFREVFQPHTGSWIHEHPDLHGVSRLYYRHYKPRPVIKLPTRS